MNEPADDAAFKAGNRTGKTLTGLEAADLQGSIGLEAPETPDISDLVPAEPLIPVEIEMEVGEVLRISMRSSRVMEDQLMVSVVHRITDRETLIQVLGGLVEHLIGELNAARNT